MYVRFPSGHRAGAGDAVNEFTLSRIHSPSLRTRDRLFSRERKRLVETFIQILTTNVWVAIMLTTLAVARVRSVSSRGHSIVMRDRQARYQSTLWVAPYTMLDCDTRHKHRGDHRAPGQVH